MLKNLYISNAAVAKNIDVDFENGFSVVTGETGSGKSVMIDCLQMISGSKTSKDIIRSGENKAVVSALFQLSKDDEAVFDILGIDRDENGELLLSRTLTADGRSTVKANGRSVTLAVLKEASRALLGINTQDEKVFLSDKNEYTAILDNFAEDHDLLAEYKKSYTSLMQTEAELSNLREDLKEKSMMVDILSYQIKEIENARLSADDEYEKLEKLRSKIKSAEKITKSKKIVYKALFQNDKGYSAAYLLERASAALSQISDMVDGAPDMIRRLEEYRYDIVDIAETVNSALDLGFEGDPTEKLNQVESRLNLLDKLKKKYGSTIAEIKEFKNDASVKLKKYTDSDDAVSELEDRIKRLYAEAKIAADKLRDCRSRAAKTLSEDIISTLRYLDMPKVKFTIEVIPDIDNGKFKFTSKGADVIDFKISVNPGEAPVSLAKVASGGEMSRVMLALRSSINKKTASDTVIFDEIDAGVSGSTSERIGLLLKKLSKSVQVICVTHSPQIASVADYHYLISKTEVSGRAESKIKLLEDDERINEISRIIGGIDVTDKQRAAAGEMLLKGKTQNLT
ncbi:MAG: DNA repair protein RecN [Clostridia bacterium]|nr:DNA repair protein RecN [Clostridia bacterium]